MPRANAPIGFSIGMLKTPQPKSKNSQQRKPSPTEQDHATSASAESALARLGLLRFAVLALVRM